METPLKGTRRKLKKVLKKSRASLSVNVNSIYQKKLKSAINVSLNSTLTLRTLQTNNRSLASSLEKMRQDFRQVHDHYTRLLEENHSLREKILELQRIDVSEKYIEDEVNKRFEDRMKDVKKKLDPLYGYTRGFLDTLTELSDVCKNKTLTVDDLNSTESSNHNYTMLSILQPFSADSSLDDMSDVESTESACTPEIDMEPAGLDKNSAHARDNVHEMTLIMEQSMLCPSAENGTSIGGKLDSVSESTLSTSPMVAKQTTATKLPVRVPKCPKRARKSIGRLASKNSTEPVKKVSRRETFIITTDEPPDDALLTDIVMPQFLVSDCLSEDELLGVENQDPVPTTISPARGRQSNEKNVNKRRANRLSCISPKKSHPKTFHAGDKSPHKLSPELPSPGKMKQTRKQSLPERARSQPRSGRTSPKKKSSPVTPHTEKQDPVTEGPMNQKPATRVKKKKSPLSAKFNKMSPKHLPRSPKHLPRPEGKKNQQNLFISNQFNLLNVHKERVETTDSKPNHTIIKHCHPQEIGEHTIFPIDDMELTRMEDEILKASIYHVTSLAGCNERNSEEFESLLSIAHSVNMSKQTGLTKIEADTTVEEKVPDAVTTRSTKPGQFTFSVSRKESDGTRKIVPNAVPKARSKSKKLLAEMIEKLPVTEPKSIFDFHEKTPGFLSNEKQASSVYNISADESSLSPMIPLNKNRSRGRQSNISSNDLPSKCALHSEYFDTNKKTSNLFYDGQTFMESRGRQSNISSNDLPSKCALHSEYFDTNKKTSNLFYDGQTFMEPVKDGSPPSKSIYKTRSRSRGRKLYDSESGQMEVRTRSQSRKRSTHPHLESPVNAVPSTSEILSSTLQTSSETGNPHSGQDRSKELTSIKSKTEDLTASLLDTDAFSEQTEGSSGSWDREMEVKTGENIAAQKRVSSPSILAQTKRCVSGKKSNKNGDIDDPLDVFSVVETTENIVEKECMTLLEPESNNLESISEILQVGDLKCHRSSDASSSKSQDTNNLISEFDEVLMSTEESRSAIHESKSLEVLNTETFLRNTVRRRNARRSTVNKIGERSSSLSVAPPIEDDLESISSETGNFISARKNRTKGKKGVKGSAESTVGNERKGLQVFKDDLVADGDNGVKLSAESTVSKGLQVFKDDLAADGDNSVRTNLTQMKEVFAEVETDLFLDKLRHLKTPALSFSEERMHSETKTAMSDKDESSQKISHGPRTSKIVRVLPSDRPASVTKRTASASSPDSLTANDGKRRRAAAKISNYAEGRLNSKLRRGDPCTSHYCTGDKIEIYKSPKSKAKKKVVHRNILGNLQNLSIKEEQGLTSEEK